MNQARVLLGVLATAVALPALAQNDLPPAPVVFVEACERPVRSEVRLPGTVEARTFSLVASDVEGLVTVLSAREGDRVRRGQPLVELRRDELQLRLAAAKGQLSEARAHLDQAEARLERARDLFDEQILSRDELDAAQYSRAAGAGRVDQLQAEIATIELALERSIVRAPFAGVVTAERTQVGEWVGRGDPVAELISLDDLEVHLDLPDRHYAEVGPDAPVRLRFESLPDHVVAGRVAALIPRANQQARTFPLRIRLEADGGRAAPGMLAEVALPVGAERQALVIPKDAILTRADERFVFRLTTGDSVERVDVGLGVASGSWVEVTRGLSPGDRVVVRGNERLRPGQKVVATPGEVEGP
jgi:RND family efflux transporter MFP subunit